VKKEEEKLIFTDSFLKFKHTNRFLAKEKTSFSKNRKERPWNKINGDNLPMNEQNVTNVWDFCENVWPLLQGRG
jgi:hypothetical protein